jgi:hypothetical protein
LSFFFSLFSFFFSLFAFLIRGLSCDAGDAGDAGEDPRTLARRSMAVANFSNLLTNPFNFIYR